MASRSLLMRVRLLPPHPDNGTNTSGQAQRTLYYGWVLMVVLGITTIISYGTSQYLFGVLVVPLDATFGWGRASISGAYSLGLILAGLLGLPIGRLVDRRGARLLMSGGSVLAAITLFGLARVEALWQFYLLWSGGLGLAMALTLYPVTFIVVANWFVQKRGTALAVLTLIGGLSSPICIPLAGALVAHMGWRATLVVLGFAQVAIALPLHAFLLRRHPEDLGLFPDGEQAPGGRFAVSDIVFQGHLPQALRTDMDSWAGCIAGALEEESYRNLLRDAGFADIEVEVTRRYSLADIAGNGASASISALPTVEQLEVDGRFVSAFIRARKPEPPAFRTVHSSVPGPRGC